MSDVIPATNPPWFRCPQPDQWKSYVDGGTEVDLGPFLTSLVRLLKPHQVLETGTYYGTSAIALGKGCRDNGMGIVRTVETNRDRVIEARNRLTAEGLTDWVSVHHASSLDTDPEMLGWVYGLIDLMFCDGYVDRWREIRRFERYFSARCLVVAHDSADPASGYRQHLSDYHRVEIGTPTGLMLLQRCW